VRNMSGGRPSGWSAWLTGGNWVKRAGLAAIVLTVFLILLWIILPVVTVFQHAPAQPDIFARAIDEAQRKNSLHFELWYKINFLIQFALILTALAATVLASRTTKENAEHYKNWSVWLTAITAALAAGQSTFHIRENIQTFIKAAVDLNQLEADYLAARAPLMEEARSKEPNSDSQKKLLELQRVYVKRYNIILSDRMHAWANVGQQSTPTASPPPLDVNNTAAKTAAAQ
jgi:hypothetical protein